MLNIYIYVYMSLGNYFDANNQSPYNKKTELTEYYENSKIFENNEHECKY